MRTVQSYLQAEHPKMISRSDFDIFDRNPDPALDELIELAAVLSGADYAYLGWMDFNRLWFKAKFGFKGAELARSLTACHWIVETGHSLLVEDATTDSRFPASGLELPGAKPTPAHAEPVLRRRAVGGRQPSSSWDVGSFVAQAQTISKGTPHSPRGVDAPDH